ncbi:MAG: alpha/beta hydrolase [Microcoleaceae cyanobacterium]
MNFSVKPGFRSPFKFFSQGISKYISLGVAMILGVISSIIIFAQPTPAVDALQIKYGAANIPIEFAELTTFAETGEQSNQLRALFNLAKLSDAQIADVRTALNFGFNVPEGIVDSLLSSSYGRLALGAFSLFVKSGSQIDQIADNVIDAVKVATQDGNLTFLELILSYEGIDVIVVDAEALVGIYQDISGFGEQAVEFLRAQPEVQGLICG